MFFVLFNTLHIIIIWCNCALLFVKCDLFSVASVYAAV